MRIEVVDCWEMPRKLVRKKSPLRWEEIRSSYANYNYLDKRQHLDFY